MSSTVLLAIDIGNTNVTLGTLRLRGRRRATRRSTGASPRTASRPPTSSAITLRALFDQAGIDPREVERRDHLERRAAAAADLGARLPRSSSTASRWSSGPASRPACRSATRTRARSAPTASSTRSRRYELMGGPVIAVDFGTATTFDCVSDKGEYLGGAIFPGIVIAMEALFSARRDAAPRRARAAALGDRQDHHRGAPVGPALRLRRHGGRHGRRASAASSARDGARDRDRRPRRPHRQRDARAIERVEPFLTLEGLRILFEKNRVDRGRHATQGEVAP